MTKVKKIKFSNQFCMRCPTCTRSDQIDVTALVNVRLVRNGTDADESQDGSHWWDADSPAHCANCNLSGTVADFKTYQCQNCLAVLNLSALKVEIKDIHQRVGPGEPMPAGECPECGALCHLLEDEDEIEGA